MRRTPCANPTFGLFAVFLAFLTLTVFTAACAPRSGLAPGQTLALASASENGVDVSISIERTSEGIILLHATFTPPAGDHLYSKDILITGVDGLGRPTLFELTADSKMQALGSLGESVPAIDLDFEYQKLPIYPAGPVMFHSESRALPEASTEVFREGEDIENRKGDLKRAAETYRGLTGAREPAVRAGAWLRLGRTSRKGRGYGAARSGGPRNGRAPESRCRHDYYWTNTDINL